MAVVSNAPINTAINNQLLKCPTPRISSREEKTATSTCIYSGRTSITARYKGKLHSAIQCTVTWTPKGVSLNALTEMIPSLPMYCLS